MLDSYSFRTMLQISDYLCGEVVGYVSGGWYFPSEKAHNVRAGEGCHTMVHESAVVVCEESRVTEHDVCSPFALHNRPVVVQWEELEDLVVSRIEKSGELFEMLGPGCPKLLVHKTLGLGNILNPGETVVLPLVAQLGIIHLPSKPFTTVETDLNVKWEPRLDPTVHKSENRMDVVMVEVKTFSPSADEFQLSCLTVVIDIERQTWFDRAEHANQTSLNAVLTCQFMCEAFLRRLARGKIDKGPGALGGDAFGSFFQLAAHFQHMFGEIFEQNLSLPQVRYHPVGIHNVSQRPTKEQSVKTIQYPDDIRGVFMQKCLHGVPPSTKLVFGYNSIHQKEEHLLILVAARGSVLQKGVFRRFLSSFFPNSLPDYPTALSPQLQLALTLLQFAGDLPCLIEILFRHGLFTPLFI